MNRFYIVNAELNSARSLAKEEALDEIDKNPDNMPLVYPLKSQFKEGSSKYWIEQGKFLYEGPSFSDGIRVCTLRTDVFIDKHTPIAISG